jgi:hypothetical protein
MRIRSLSIYPAPSVLLILAVAMSGLPTVRLVATAQSIDPEYHLKAAVVSKFPEFVEWPPAALDSRTTIDLCVARPNPFGVALAQLVSGESLRGRTVVTREVASGNDLRTCHLLFVPRGSDIDTHVLIAGAAKHHVLTVGESPRFLEDGGIINLHLVDGRIRFEVDMNAANRAGVRLSSQLLRLATLVRGGPS